MHLLMSDFSLAVDDVLTQTLAGRVQKVWEAFRRVDVKALDVVLDDDYSAVHPDGTVTSGKPSEQELASAEVDRYHLSSLRAVPIGPEGALVTYIAEVGIASHLSPATVRLAVGEVWLKPFRDWKCRYYQATVLK
jgi:hypothetical protein